VPSKSPSRRGRWKRKATLRFRIISPKNHTHYSKTSQHKLRAVRDAQIRLLQWYERKERLEGIHHELHYIQVKSDLLSTPC
jgi:hypothetical protein